MSDTFDASFAHDLESQSWTFYGIGMLMIVIRTFARWRRVQSLRHFEVDDWLMVLAVPLFYTGLIVCLNVIARGGGSNLFPPEQLATFTQQEIEERIKGSKIVVVSEQCMLNVIWTLKACMLFMFARMTTGTTHIKWIRFVATWVAVGWVAVQIAFFTACRPFKGYWSVPPPNPQCTTLEHYAIVQAAFNISSDLLIIAVPLPMINSLKLPVKQKIGLAVLFSMGIFVIAAAILTKVYNLDDVYSTVYMLWYTREASVAVYVANLPGIWPLLREHIRIFRDHTNSYVAGSKTPKYGYGSKFGSVKGGGRSRVRTVNGETDSDEIELGLGHQYAKSDTAEISNKNPSGTTGISVKTSLDSDERALNDAAMTSWTQRGVVQVDTKVEIQRNNYNIGTGDGPLIQVKIEGPQGEVDSRG